MNRNLVCVLSVIGGAALVGCDNGTVEEPDAGGPVVELPPAAAYVETADDFMATTLDLSCRGARTRPVGGEPVDLTFQLRDFQDDFAVTGSEVWLFSDNTIADACTGATCQVLTTNASGDASATLPAGGWYAYRVLPQEGPTRVSSVFGVFQYNEPAPTSAGRSVIGNSVNGMTIEVIPALLGITREPGLAIVAGRIEDCDGSFIQNAVVRVYDPDGDLIEQGTLGSEPGYHYFNGNPDSNLPNQSETYSNVDGLYVVVQVPIVDNRPYRMEAWANVDGETQRIGCESARIFPDAVTILNIGPERADADPACL